MRYSQLFGKTRREVPRDEVSINAKLLTRGGFVRREVAGVYNFLPLGLRVLNKITDIVREEMNKAGGQEILLSSLQNRENWKKTGRWDKFDSLFKVKSRFDTEYALGPTHEEVLVPLVRQFVSSYRDLPLSLYQIQNKFRDEARAKSGILRGREFLMKDLYSFHADDKDFISYYEKLKDTYKKIFKRCGLKAILTEASGGVFSKTSHEFQVLTENGEDTIYYCTGHNCGLSQNEEIAKVKEGDKCPKCAKAGHDEIVKKGKSIEVGNIFPLKTRFSEAFGLTYKDEKGVDQLVVMGCYGLGITRVMGAIVEVRHDKNGIVWPESVTPYQVHLIDLTRLILESRINLKSKAEEVYKKLQDAGVEVLFDDRTDTSAGEKLTDADLIGIPVRLVLSERTGDKIEMKRRDSQEVEILSFDEVLGRTQATP